MIFIKEYSVKFEHDKQFFFLLLTQVNKTIEKYITLNGMRNMLQKIHEMSHLSAPLSFFFPSLIFTINRCQQIIIINICNF